MTAWRRDARKGRLALPVDAAAPFAALVVEEPLAAVPAPSLPPTMIEIETGGVVVRLAADAPAVRVAEIAAALRGCR